MGLAQDKTTISNMHSKVQKALMLVCERFREKT